MSLDLGELVGTMGLDITPFEQKLARGDAALDGFTRTGEAKSKAAGSAMGAAVAAGLDTVPAAAGSAGRQAATELGTGLDHAADVAASAGTAAGSKFSDSFKEKAKETAKIAGAAVGAALGAGVVDNLSLEQGRLKVAAQLGLTPAESGRIGKIAGTVYSNNFGDGIDEVNGAVAAVVSSLRGMRRATDSEIGAATQSALAFADVFDIDVNRAVSVAGTVLRSGLAKNSKQAFDLLTQASSKVPVDLREDVLDASEEYSQFFAGLGYSGPQAFAMLVDGAKKGMYGIDKTGDAVKEFTIRATDMSESTMAAYHNIGLPMDEMTRKLLGGGAGAQKATQRIIRGLLAIKDPAWQSKQALALFGTPLEDLNTSQIPGFLRSLQGSSKSMKSWRGAATDMANTAGGGTANSLETAKRSVIQWGRGVIESTGPTTAFAGALAAFGPAVLSVLAPVAQLVAARAVQTAAAGTAAGAETAASTAVQQGWIRSAAASVAGAARMAASWLIAIGPIAIVIAAVAGLGFLIYKHWDKIKAVTVRVWGAIVGFVKGIPGRLLSFFLNWTIAGQIIQHWSAIKAGTSRVWNATVGFVKGIPGRILSFFLNWTLAGQIIKHWDQVKSGTVRVASAMVSWVAGLPGRIVHAIGDLSGLLAGAGADAARGLWEGLKSMGGWLKGQVTAWVKAVIPGPIRKALGIASPSKVTTEQGRDTARGLPRGLDAERRTVSDGAKRTADNLVNSLKNRLSNRRNELSSLLSTYTSIADQVSGAYMSSSLFGGTAAELNSGLDAQNAGLSTALAAVAQLRKMGARNDFLTSLASSGNTALLQELANGSTAALQREQKKFIAGQSMAAQLGRSVADGTATAADIHEVRDAIQHLEAAIKKQRPIHVDDKSGDPKRTAKETARQLAHGGGG